jgi:hypothetical protein
MSIFSSINNNNDKTFISTITISFVLTITTGSLFFVSAISNQTFAQEGFTLEDLDPIERESLLSNLTDSSNNNILQKVKVSISAKEPNEGLTTDELVNGTILLENETRNETIIGRQEKQEQGTTSLEEQLKLAQEKIKKQEHVGGSTLEEQLKLAQEKLNQLGLGSFSNSGKSSVIMNVITPSSKHSVYIFKNLVILVK